MTATMFEAKTRFLELVDRAQAGEDVIITSGSDQTPVARLQAIDPVKPMRLGSMAIPGWKLGEAFWEELPAVWDGTTE